MPESWCDNELRLSILVRNETELLWLSADNIILVVYPIKFIFTCLSYSGWISLGTNRFGFNLLRFISGSGLHRVNKSSGQFRFDSGHIEFRSIRVITVLSRFGFGSVQFRISGQNQFNSFSCRFGFGFWSFDSGHFCQVYASYNCPQIIFQNTH